MIHFRMICSHLTQGVLFRFRFSGIIFRSVGIMGDSGLLILQFCNGFQERLCGLNGFIEPRLQEGVLFHHAFSDGVCFLNNLGFNFLYVNMCVCF